MPPKICPECGIPIGTPLPPLRRFSILALLPFFCMIATLAIVIWRPLNTIRSTPGGMWTKTVARFPGPEFTAGYLRRIADGTMFSDSSLASRLLGPSVLGINVPSTPDDATLRIGIGPSSGYRSETIGYGWPSYWIRRSEQSPYDNIFERTGTHPPRKGNAGGVFLVGSYVDVSFGIDPITGRWLDWVIDASGPATSAAIVVFCWGILCALRWGIRRYFKNSGPWIHRFPIRATMLIVVVILLAGFLPLNPDLNFNSDRSKLTFHQTQLRHDQLTSTKPRLSDSEIARSLLAALPADIPTDVPLATEFLMHPGNNVIGTDTMYGVPAWIYKITQTRVHPMGESATPFPQCPSHIEFSGWDRTIFYAPVPPGSATRTFFQLETPIIIQQLFLIYLAWAIPMFSIRQIRNAITRRRSRNNACIACGYAMN